MSVLLPTGIFALVKTLRFKWSGSPLPDKCIVAFWHSKMLAGWYASKENAVALVSPSKDGDRLTSVLKKWLYTVVRGSSSKKGMEALEEAMAMISSSNAKRIVITPDGPRGPAEIMKRGAFIAAKELGLPLIFLHINYRSSYKLTKSWDKFEIPLPFSAVDIIAEELDTSVFPGGKDEQRAYLEVVSTKLRGDRV
ncbi:MAG TPA: DUF374 domain-containing protein [Candidatus Kapabacteria bacterium]